MLIPLGFTHSPGRHLFELGRPASRALKAFAEEGRGIRSSGSRWMVGEEEEDGVAAAEAVFDAFAAPPIRKGTGRTRARIFVDSKHSKVSIKIFYVLRFIENGFPSFSRFRLCPSWCPPPIGSSGPTASSFAGTESSWTRSRRT